VLASMRLLNAFYRSDESNSWVQVNDAQESTRLGCAVEELANLYRTADI
jgi:UDP-N-acetyl-2-amino-2-deoxyglucuronate dehydrogenase